METEKTGGGLQRLKVLESQMEAHGSDSNCQSSVMWGSQSHTK